MAYTAWVNRATGYVALATDWNIIGANFAAGVPDIFTAKGDLAVGTAADTAGVLAVGADGLLLSALAAEATGLKYITPNTAQAYAKYKVSATRSMVNTVATIVNFDTSVYDSDTAVTTGASWKFTVPADHGGYFVVATMLMLESNAGWGINEYFEADVYVDNALYTSIARWTAQAAGTYVAAVSGMAIVYAAAASYIDIRGLQNSGGNINVAADGNYSHIAIARLF